jgi:hypothetical protein
MNEKNFMTKRAQMAFIGVGLWFFLAAWSISAFWQHIDELGATYRNGARLGAIGAEFALLMYVLLHCFNPHLGVRRWALIFSFILGSVILIHTGALRGLSEATTAQIATEKRMAETLTEMSQKQAQAITPDNTGTQRERLAKNRAAVSSQADVAKNAQKEVAETIAASTDRVKDSSIMPRWYLDGWMYGVIFIAALLFTTILFLLMMRDDVDADFDGIADKYQKTRQPITMAPTTVPATAQKSNFYDPTSGKS